MSFTLGGLFFNEAQVLVPLYLESKNWKSVRDNVYQTNALQSRSEGSLHRLFSEVKLRLEVLNDSELNAYLNLSSSSQKQLLWIAACRRYGFIADFAKDKLHENYITMRNTVTQDDLDDFISSKLLWHEELQELKESTLKKCRSVLFQIMREAELLDKQDYIISTFIDNELGELIKENNHQELDYFPTLQKVGDF
jgi:hypothetical protein